MTLNQKAIAALKTAIIHLKRSAERRDYYGICALLPLWMEEWWMKQRPNIFSKFWWNKYYQPFDLFWWTLDEGGNNQRIRYLEFLIEKLEKEK